MALSFFDTKESEPNQSDLKKAVGNLYDSWLAIKKYTLTEYPGAVEQWNYSGQKYGWGFRLKDKKRAIIYLIPQDGFFLVAFVLGKAASVVALQSTISDELKNIISEAKVYAEGRGFRFEFKEASFIVDVKTLIEIKLKN